ncbi:MAG: glutathione S-transferase [Pseudomonadales bacterium]|nr:glutathione S-transferase [Pseudomonadales bacterium]MCK5790388.1 glutathione S-transferase family protein [Ketobacter sp.]MEC8812735.1 glutathione S-transferase family protein [Pseudomonadota bacterium]TNC90561.1 MAG: glutathione S-transferase [Alcanivorax sp.]HAG92517.1 glutathione S-transferase family protein [Gammaproteobacteria bacterium]
MSDLILHHYALSPFSQKVRSMLGYADLPWQSAITREMPPRPIVATLTGGYRKIPVAQCGADVFCDTAVISSEIAVRAGKPQLARQNCSDEVNRFIAHVELEVFFACVMSSASWALNKKVLQTLSIIDLFKFFADRIRMGRTASVRMVKPGEAPAIVKQHLKDMESRLQQDFLFGAEPNIADFAAYHSLWMIRDAAEKKTLQPYARVNAWMDRMNAFGEGRRSEINPDETLVLARNSEPRAITAEEKQDALLGCRVSIAPADYAQDASVGELVGASANRWIIARSDPAVGLVHVHFPKQGFSIVEI